MRSEADVAAGTGAREEELRTRTTHVRRWRQIRQQRGEGGVCRVGPGFDFCAFLRVTAGHRAIDVCRGREVSCARPYTKRMAGELQFI